MKNNNLVLKNSFSLLDDYRSVFDNEIHECEFRVLDSDYPLNYIDENKIDSYMIESLQNRVVDFYSNIESEFDGLIIETNVDNGNALEFEQIITIDKDLAIEFIDAHGFYDSEILDVDFDKAESYLLNIIDNLDSIYGFNNVEIHDWCMDKLFNNIWNDGCYPYGSEIEDAIVYKPFMNRYRGYELELFKRDLSYNEENDVGLKKEKYNEITNCYDCLMVHGDDEFVISDLYEIDLEKLHNMNIVIM
jgi:hypothetical protein